MAKRQGRANRSSGIVYTALSAALVIVVATLAITASQSAPPAIAELAPSPQNQIKDAPQEQSSELGSGDGGAGLGGATTTTTTAPPAVGPTTTLPPKRLPRQRKCVGSPPRQTEDPQSPACVPSWDGTDNGGATSKGVTREEIRIAVPSGGTTNSRDIAALESYFNTRFEFYGRRLRMLSYNNAGNFTTCAKMQADAVKVDKEIDAFASLRYSIQDGMEGCYYDELGRRKIISLQTSGVGTPSTTEAHLSATPYQWNYYPAVDTILNNLGEVICKQLSTGGPRYAGAPQAASGIRKFGIVVDSTASGVPPPDPTPLFAKTRPCGIAWERVDIDVQSQIYTQTQPMLKMKDAGVTTVVCLCGYDYYKLGMMTAATAEGYFPEWIVQNFRGQDDDIGGHSYPPEQAAHVFGLRSRNKALPRDQMPYWAAFREADPTFPAGLYNWSDQYWNVLLLASGIQGAGPNLTPETFASGLQRAVFPNPGCGGPPHYQACVGFQGDHTMVNDFAWEWYDPNGTSQELDAAYGNQEFSRNSGTYCYAELGRRHRAGQWPSPGPVLFQGACR